MWQDTRFHGGLQRGDDAIDFKCSPTWLNHFADQGLTSRRAPRERKQPIRIPNWNDEIQAARERIAALEQDNRLLQLEKARLQTGLGAPRQRLPPTEKAAMAFRGIDLDASTKN